MDKAKQQMREDIGVQFGKYRVFARLATGGMAEIFLAKQPGIGGFRKTVALKCILPHLAKEEQFVQMFLDEARIAACLEHPNIVRILEIGETGGVYFIAMEYIRGQSLREFRKRLYKQRPPVASPYAASAAVLAQSAAGLHYAHTAVDDDGYPLRVIHRDISPTNLLISLNGVVKVVDFGVAKATTQQHHTSAGTIKGKYRYMSPEQIANKELDCRSDIFSLGIILYEMTTNVGLFGRRSEIEVIKAVSEAQVMAPSKFDRAYPEELEAIVMKALAKDRELRYQTADELRQDLERFMHSSGEFFGNAQLAEVMQELFPEDLRTDQTGVHSPLTPADLVRFAGEYSSSDAIPSYQRSGYGSQVSQPQWPQGTPPNYPHPSGSSPMLPTYQTGTGLPPHAHISGLQHHHSAAQMQAHQSGLLAHQSAAHMHPSAPQTPARSPYLLAQMDIEELKAIAAQGSDEITLAGVVAEGERPDPHAELPPQQASKKTLWVAILLTLVISASLAAWFLMRPDDKSLQDQRRQISALIQEGEYTKAAMQLRIFQQMEGAKAHQSWISEQLRVVEVAPQIAMAEKLLKEEKLLAAQQIIQVLQSQAPQHPKIKELAEKVTKAMASAQRPAPMPTPIPPLRTQQTPIETTQDPPDEETSATKKRRPKSRKYKARKRPVKVAVVQPRDREAPKDRQEVEQKGKLYVNASPPARVELNGQLVGYTPINNYTALAGNYRLTLIRAGHQTVTRQITIRPDKPVDINVEMKAISAPQPRIAARIVEPPPRIRTEPPADDGKAKPALPIESLRLPKKLTLRVFMSDPRGIAGRHYTDAHPKLCQQIEAELKRVMGSNFSVTDITRPWLKYVLEKARASGNDYYTFYPLAVAKVAYQQLEQGRAKKRVAQILVSYDLRNRFKSL